MFLERSLTVEIYPDCVEIVDKIYSLCVCIHSILFHFNTFLMCVNSVDSVLSFLALQITRLTDYTFYLIMRPIYYMIPVDSILFWPMFVCEYFSFTYGSFLTALLVLLYLLVCRNSFLDSPSDQKDVETDVNNSTFVNKFYKNFKEVVSNVISAYFKK